MKLKVKQLAVLFGMTLLLGVFVAGISGCQPKSEGEGDTPAASAGAPEEAASAPAEPAKEH